MNNRMTVQNRGGDKYNYAVCLLRILACCMIVWNHLSGHMLNGWGNPLSWANIGVQIFFFMSGWLYSKQEITNPTEWIRRNLEKIYIPYELSLIMILPVISYLTVGNVTTRKTIAAVLGMQGFGFTIEGVGQHWFVSYIILCYFITPTILYRLRCKFNRNGTWLWLGIFAILVQIVTIPLALVFNFKVSYIFGYIIGYIYGFRYNTDSSQEHEKKIINMFIILVAFLGVGFRIYLTRYNYSGFMENVCDLLIQWIKVIQGCAIFIIFTAVVSSEMSAVSDSIKKYLKIVSNYTFEIYLVHEFFTMSMFTELFHISFGLKVSVILISIAVATILLVMMEKVVTWIRYSSRKGRTK